MTKSKFTKGPYCVNNPLKHDNRELWVYSGATYLGTVDNHRMAPEEIAANAELWADAPRLLEALRKLLTYSEPLLGWQHIDEADQAFGDANELIDKHGG